jgi:hypothetical protein
MKSLLNPTDRNEIVSRIHRLSPASSRRWGVMTVNQAIVHVTDPFRDALSERETKRVVPRFLAPLIKPMVLSKKPFKPGTRTLRPYDQAKGFGTPTTNFNDDLQALLVRVDRFANATSYGVHPAIGGLSGDEWGRLLHKEIDHHLRQFGV